MLHSVHCWIFDSISLMCSEMFNTHRCSILNAHNVQTPLITTDVRSAALVNGCPTLNGDLRGVGMTLYKGSNVECCPRGAAKVTEDNCVWHPAAPQQSTSTSTQEGASRRCIRAAVLCRAMQAIQVQWRAMQAIQVQCRAMQMKFGCNAMQQLKSEVDKRLAHLHIYTE